MHIYETNSEKYDRFKSELEKLINHHSMQDISGTPDHILANYLIECLKVFDQSQNQCIEWHSIRELDDTKNH